MLDLTLASGTYRASLARVGQGGMPERRYLWVPHDTNRYDFDDRLRQHSDGWKYNPAGTGHARAITQETRQSRPEIYRLLPLHSFNMTAPWYALLAGINPELDPDEAVSILNKAVCYCNTRTGLLDQIRITAGATVEELKREGERLYIRTISTREPVPSAASVLADRALWHYVTGVQPDGDVNFVLRWNKAHTEKIPVRMLNISSVPVYMLADEFLPVDDFKHPQWKPV